MNHQSVILGVADPLKMYLRENPSNFRQSHMDEFLSYEDAMGLIFQDFV